MSIVPSHQGLQSSRDIANGVAVGAFHDEVSGSRPSQTSSFGRPPSSGFDIWGVLARRKYIVGLLFVAGAILGYFNYSKTAPTYSSSTRLLIVTQAPPAIVDGNFRLEQKTSLAKHQSLLASELVLGSAIKRGNLQNLETFDGFRNPIEPLKTMLRVTPGNEETLTLACSGPVPDDLPKILNHIVLAYESIIEEDSQNVSEETVKLVSELAGELSDEKKRAEAARLKLWKELGIDAVSESGTVTNPHAPRLAELRKNHDQLEAELGDIHLKRRQLAEFLKSSGQPEGEDFLKQSVVAIEAREYLNLNRSDYTDEKQGGLQDLSSEESELNTRLQRVEEIIFDVQTELLSKSRTRGAGHPEIANLKSQLRRYRSQQDWLARELADLVSVGDGAVDSVKDQQAVIEEFRRKENLRWIAMYELALQKRKNTLEARIDESVQSIGEVSKASSGIADKILELNVLQNKVESKDREANLVLDRLKELNVLANNYVMTKVRTLDPAKMGFKIAPSLTKNIAMGSMLAFLAGLGIAVLIDRGELSFHNPDEIRELLAMPVVGKIPRLKAGKTRPSKGVAELIAAHKPGSTAAESFRNTRTSLFFRANAEDVKVIMITSPSPGDGKSTTAANLAISIAQAGKRTVLVDADFRRPRVDQYFGEELEGGLLDVLNGEVTVEEAVRPSGLQEGLDLFTAGGRPKNPAELVSSPEFRALLDDLRQQYDFVIVDAPPVLPVSDPAAIASAVDGVFLVMRIRKGIKLTARKAKDTLDQVGANWLGIIINDVDENRHYHEYGYQYGYGYSNYGNYGRYYESRHQNYRDDVRIEAQVTKRG